MGRTVREGFSWLSPPGDCFEGIRLSHYHYPAGAGGMGVLRLSILLLMHGNSGLFVVVGRYCMWDAWDDSACRLFAAGVAVVFVVGRYCVRSAWDDSACRVFAAGFTAVGIVWLEIGGTESRSVWIPVLADASPAFGNDRLRKVGGFSLGVLDLVPVTVAAAAKKDAGAEGKWDAEIMMISKYSKNVEKFKPQRFPKLSLGVVKMIDFPDFSLTIA